MLADGDRFRHFLPSQAIPLVPGGVIITGAPAGVAPMKPGGVVDIELEHIGALTNPVAAEAAAE